MSTTTSNDMLIRVLLVGDPDVGKTTLMWRTCDNILLTAEQANITLNNTMKSKTIQLGKKQIVVRFHDTVGQERFRTLSKSLYTNTDAIILTYDPSTRSSFERLPSWWQEIERYAKAANPKLFIALATTKSDLAASTQVVTVAEGQEFANQKGITLMHTSAATGAGVDELLQLVAKNAGEKLFAEENWTKLRIKSPNRSSPTLSGSNGVAATGGSSSGGSSSGSGNNNAGGNSPAGEKKSFCTIL
ncbi:hypothetical protein SAMD00019534_103140 [Acytostelium subglobosum LB1]|uniref:hypothetical protein n=1 Tax=Acytostelium subglobosum LB1 TaxID=1410327 RepID=UPI0006450C1D|nr:hypothetical protein SAMD00019534_103140 [Acytostelium subglobosum LB1]GAM27139.1 hypothetical protein SAMD00019534_103140 [Acytostelium subglobosum LB1]|eukprot:XP_012750019.1 hypothetical protein SAMD00019534_103140 [Acytostelium subglobosum LB1]